MSGWSARRRRAILRARAAKLRELERAAGRGLGLFLARQLDEILAAVSRGRKDAGTDFWARIQVGAGLTVDLNGLRGLAAQALDSLVDWEAQDRALTAALSPVWSNAFEAGAGSMRELIGTAPVSAPSLTDYLRRRGLKRVKDINETTRAKLAASLADGLAAGEGQTQLARRVREHMPEIQAERARAIAASESHTSMQSGSFEQMRYGGVPAKTWDTAGDGDVRPSHAALQGLTIPIDKPFPNGCMYPGDPAGAPGEIINCRCDLLPGEM